MLKIKLSKRFLCAIITLALLAGYTFVPMMASAVTEETDTYRYFDYSDQTDGVLTISSSGNINLTEQKATNITESIVVGGRFKVDSAYTGSNFLIPVSGGFNFDINSYRQFVISGSSSQSENVKSQHAITKISKVPDDWFDLRIYMDYSNILGGGANRLYVFINGEDVTPTTLYTRAPAGLSKDHFRVVSSGNGTIYVDNFLIYRPGQAASVIGVSKYSVWESLDSSLAEHKLPLTAEFGSSISWSSDSAITINADGSFETALKSVALTATITMGEATPAITTKTVIVPSKGTLGTGDNWYYDGFDTNDNFGNWTNVKNAIVSDGVLSVVGAGSQANFVSPKTWSGTIVFESRVKYDENSWVSGETLLFVKSGGGGGFNIIVNQNGEVVIKTSSSKVADSVRKDVVLYKTANQWFDLKWIVDFNNNGKISAFIDGVEIDPDSLGYSRAEASAYKADAVLLDTKIVTGATGGVYIDEVMVYNDTWMDTVGVTKAGLKVTEDALVSRRLPTTGRNNSSITWSSSTTGVTVGADGAIDAPLDTDTAAVLTATISAGDYSETKEFNVTIPKVIPYVFTPGELMASAKTMEVSVQNHTSAAITPAVIAAVYSGDQLIDVALNTTTQIAGGGHEKLTITFAKALENGCSVKLFTWDSLSVMRPYGKAIPITVVSE